MPDAVRIWQERGTMQKRIKGGTCAVLAASMLMLAPLTSMADTAVPMNPDGTAAADVQPVSTVPQTAESASQETPGVIYAPSKKEQSNAVGPGAGLPGPAGDGDSTAAGPVPGGSQVPGGSTGGTELISPEGQNAQNGVLPAGWIDQTQMAEGDGTCVADDILGLRPFTNTQLVNLEGVLDVVTMKTSLDEGQWNTVGDGFIGLRSRLEQGVGSIYYRLYSEGGGWSQWGLNETTVNTPDNGKVTAFQTRLQGYTGNLYDIWYKAQLNDGTETGWTNNGKTCGTIGTGKYITGIQCMLWKKGVKFPHSTANAFYGAQYEGMVQDASGALRYQTASGTPYTGWAYVNNDKYYVQENVPLTGWQYLDGYKFYFDAQGKLVTDLEPIIGNPGDFRIKVNRARNSFTVYAKDGENGYIMPYKVFLCTVNATNTPLGTYKFYAKYRWKYMHDDPNDGGPIYCQYLNRFYNGYIVHSLIYRDKMDSFHFDASTYNYIGGQSSDGCIRLRADQAQWVYENCANGTQITIYDDNWNIGPLDRPAVEQAIPMNQTYDPTDVVARQKLGLQ